MDSQFKNDICLPKKFSRCLRAVNDHTGEYYDVFISSGTSTIQRDGIADYAHILGGFDNVWMNPMHQFLWTRCFLYNRTGKGDIDYQSDMLFYYKDQKGYFATTSMNEESRLWIEKELSTLRPICDDVEEDYLTKVVFDDK